MVIVFDLDDTLYPESAFVLSALADVGDYAEKKWNLLNFKNTLEKLFHAGEKQNLFQKAAKECRLPDFSPDQVQDLLNHYRQHRPTSLPWYPDALAVVPQLAAQYPLGLITDGYLPVQINKASALGVARWIKDIIYTEELGRVHWKPAVTAFKLIMDRHPHEKFIYIADNPRKDFVAPRQLGWSTIQIVRADGQHPAVPPGEFISADHLVHSLHEITPYISK